MDGGKNGAGMAIKAVFRTVITDLLHGLANDGGNIYDSLGRNLTHNGDDTRSRKGLASNARHGILSEHGIEYGIRDLVADLIGMPLGNGFGGKKKLTHEKTFLGKRKTPRLPEEKKAKISSLGN